MFEKFLVEIGLSEKEASVYLALLQVDFASIHDIASKTNIKRTTVYPVLESLQQKGLVSETQKDKKVLFQAAPPERLETYVDRQKILFDEKAKRLKDIIPQMKSIQREQGERPIVKYFEGRDGAISAYEEFYAFNVGKEETGYFIFNRDLLSKTFTSEELSRFLHIRKGKDLNPVSVYNYKAGDYQFTTPGTRARIDAEKYPILCDISITEDRIVITTLGEHVSAFFIKSKDIAETLTSLIKKINGV